MPYCSTTMRAGIGCNTKLGRRLWALSPGMLRSAIDHAGRRRLSAAAGGSLMRFAGDAPNPP